MHRDPRVSLADIEQAGADIARFIEGMDLEAYSADARTQAAVERKFEIVGEALNRLRGGHPEHAARIPDLRRIIGFRNVLPHGYDRVVPENVWDYATNDLPELRRVVQALLAELGPPEERTPNACSPSTTGCRDSSAQIFFPSDRTETTWDLDRQRGRIAAQIAKHLLGRWRAG